VSINFPAGASTKNGSSVKIPKGTVLAIGERKDLDDEDEDETVQDPGFKVVVKTNLDMNRGDVAFAYLTPEDSNKQHTAVTLSLKKGLISVSS